MTVGTRDLVTVSIGAVLGLTEAAQVYVGLALLGNPVSWRLALLSTVPSWAVLVALLLPTLRVLDRRSGGGGVARVAALVVGGVMFTGAHLAGTALLGDLLLPTSPGFREHFVQLTSVYFVTGLLTFVAVVTVHDAVRRYREEGRRKVSAARVVADVAEARLITLRGQLRPDFFFNTLNAASGLVARGDAQRSVELLSGLSRLLRLSLTVVPGRPSTLAEELNLVRDYLAIQHVRFPNRLEVGPHDVGSAGSRAVPSLLLVQIAEAVVDRGLGSGAPFRVYFTARVEGERLIVRLHHTGPRLDVAALARVAERLGRFHTEASLDDEHGAVRVSLPEAHTERRWRGDSLLKEER